MRSYGGRPAEQSKMLCFCINAPQAQEHVQPRMDMDSHGFFLILMATNADETSDPFLAFELLVVEKFSMTASRQSLLCSVEQRIPSPSRTNGAATR